jgi:Phage integrase family
MTSPRSPSPTRRSSCRPASPSAWRSLLSPWGSPTSAAGRAIRPLDAGGPPVQAVHRLPPHVDRHRLLPHRRHRRRARALPGRTGTTSRWSACSGASACGSSKPPAPTSPTSAKNTATASYASSAKATRPSSSHYHPPSAAPSTTPLATETAGRILLNRRRAHGPARHHPTTPCPRRRQRNVDATAAPHMLRHTYITTMLDAGVDLRDVQIAARHADPRTTMGYDRARTHLDRHPTRRLHGLRNLTQPEPARGVRSLVHDPCGNRYRLTGWVRVPAESPAGGRPPASLVLAGPR